jgi:FdrA protein
MFNKQEEMPYRRLLAGEVKVLNVGLEGFVGDLRDCGIEVVHVDWSPPAGGDPQMAALLAKLGT